MNFNFYTQSFMMLIFKQLVNEGGCASYLVGCSDKKVCAIVDPTEKIDLFLNEARRQGLRISHVIETHTHADHLSGARELAEKTNSKVYMHISSRVKFPFSPLHENQELSIGDQLFKIIHTPGHSADSICLQVESKLLTGDTLLIGDSGRMDLGGNPEQMFYSLRKLGEMKEDLEIFPSHIGESHFVSGLPNSTLFKEKENNEAMKIKSKKDFMKYATEGWPEKPFNFEKIRNYNLGIEQEKPKTKQS